MWLLTAQLERSRLSKAVRIHEEGAVVLPGPLNPLCFCSDPYAPAFFATFSNMLFANFMRI